MKIKCIIIDDEPIARRGIEGYVAKVEFLELVGTCENALELNNLLQRESADLLFLDIEMPHLTGIDFLKSVQNAPAVIFTTAYDQYAIEGYELNVLDYLLKPISFARFLKAVTKARSLLVKDHDEEKCLFIKSNNRIVRVNYDDILFIEAMQNYVTFHTVNGKFMTHLTLKSVQTELPSDQFIQIHKSYLVALNKVKSIDGNQIIMDKHNLPISKYKREEVFQAILKGKFLKK